MTGDRSPVRKLVNTLLRAPLRLVPRTAVVRVVRGPLRGARWIAGSLVHRCWLGAYETVQVEQFARAAREARVVCDIGSNVGYYALIAARVVGPQGQVFAFEPNAKTASTLRRHVALNNADNVTVMELAVTDTVGFLSFWDGGGAESRLQESGATVSVRAETLDHLIESGSIRDPDLLKIDVEGAEMGVLRGGEQLLRRARPAILLEVHDDPERECAPFLRSLGYELTPLGPNSLFARATAAAGQSRPVRTASHA